MPHNLKYINTQTLRSMVKNLKCFLLIAQMTISSTGHAEDRPIMMPRAARKTKNMSTHFVQKSENK